MTSPASSSPVPTSTCDVCQDWQAIVTLGCVDYCARCASPWRPTDAEQPAAAVAS